jgi:hypothetical protein
MIYVISASIKHLNLGYSMALNIILSKASYYYLPFSFCAARYLALASASSD